jgi:site-specific recombinase XerD
MLGTSPRLGRHHFAHLRAVAEGLSLIDAARRYLAIEHGAEAVTAHRLVVEQVRALARRRGDARWRLIGIDIRDTAAADACDAAAPPALDAWAESEGLGDWSQAELQALYEERFGAESTTLDPSSHRRLLRNTRLRERRLALLRELEAVSAEKPAPTDLLEGWLPAALAAQLRRGGDLTLGDLQRRIGQGGRWWSGIAAFGPIKARRLSAYVELLVGAPPAPNWGLVTWTNDLSAFSGRDGSNRVQTNAGAPGQGTDAQDDRQAIAAWIAARAGSPYTAAQYAREAERFLLWCVLERRRALSDATAEDCRAYMDFMANVPPAWISRHRVPRLAPGWAPFKGSLSLTSQGVAIAALHSLFAWLVQARYASANPWVLVNRKLGDDPNQRSDDPSSRAFNPQAWAALRAHLMVDTPTPSAIRLSWLCTFVECTGLRAAELLRARREHLYKTSTGWVLRVHGKGRRNRSVPVPSAGMAATRAYFASRGLNLEDALPTTPLLASLTDPNQPLGYRSFYETFTRFVKRATTSLAPEERRAVEHASAHWLRHTHATRAAERLVPLDVLQENLGQSDPRTTARYYRAQMKRREAEMERAFRDEGSLPT